MEIRWIPISETKPPVLGEKSDIVDIKLKDGGVFEGYINSAKEWFIMSDGSDDWFVDNVTHWKPTRWKVD